MTTEVDAIVEAIREAVARVAELEVQAAEQALRIEKLQEAIEVLTRAGIDRSVAASYQTLLHAVLWSTETFTGLWFMWRTGLGRADLKQPPPSGSGDASGQQLVSESSDSV